MNLGTTYQPQNRIQVCDERIKLAEVMFIRKMHYNKMVKA